MTHVDASSPAAPESPESPESSEPPESSESPESPESPVQPGASGVTDATTTSATSAEPGTSPDARPTRKAGPSIRPALAVVGIAAGLVLLFGIGAALTGTSSPSRPPHPTHVRDGGLVAVPAKVALEPIELPGTPPPDVLGAVVLPKGATRIAATPWDGSTQYNGVAHFTLAGSQAAVVRFYRSQLKARGWSISSVGAARAPKGATEVLAQRASDDGWYWEIGVVASPTTFGTGSHETTESTRFSIDLFEEPDAQ